MSIFPYDFDFFFHTPLVYKRDYQIEVRSASGALLRLITTVTFAGITETLNAATEFRVVVPFDDPANPFLTEQSELWLIDQNDVNIGKFIITQREDTNSQGQLTIDIIAMSYIYQLAGEPVNHISIDEDFFPSNSIQDIVDFLLSKQTNVNPIISGPLPASIATETRDLNVSSARSIFQILTLLINTFSQNIKMEVSASRTLTWTDLDAFPGDTKQFRTSKNLSDLTRVHLFDRPVTRLFAFGTRLSGQHIRLGDEGGDQRWEYYATTVDGQNVDLWNDFDGFDNPSGIPVKVGDAAVIDGVEFPITAVNFVPSSFSTITLFGDFTLTTPGTLTVRRDFIESQARGALVRKKIFIDYTDVALKSGYDDYVLNVDGTYRDLITANADTQIYFTDSDLSTVLDYTVTSYTQATGALVASVKIPRVSGVVNTTAYMILTTNTIAHSAAGADNGTQVPFTLLPAVNMPGFRDGSFKDERIETLTMLKESGQVKLDKFLKPSFAYVARAVDLSKVRSAPHEVFAMGEMVEVIDEKMGIDELTRIVRAQWPLNNPAELELQFDIEEERTIDSIFARTIETALEPDPPLILDEDAFKDIGGDDAVHTHNNLSTLQDIPAFAASTPYTLTSEEKFGSLLWSNINAIFSDTDGLDSAFTSDDEPLDLVGLSMSIPETRIVTGIEIRFVATEASGGSIDFQLIRDNGFGNPENVGTSKTQSVSNSFGDYVLGGSSDLWDVSDLTAAQVNNVNFGVSLQKTDNDASRVDVDWVKIKVYHAQRDGGSLKKTSTTLEWAQEQTLFIAKVISGPGVGAQQLYRVELLGAIDKSPTGVFEDNCMVPDDDAPDYLPDDLVTVAIPSGATTNAFDNAIIISSQVEQTINWQAVYRVQNEGPS